MLGVALIAGIASVAEGMAAPLGAIDDASTQTPVPAPPTAPAAPVAPAPAKHPPLTALIETERGVIKVDLGPNDVPRLVVHFVNLAERKFYDGLLIHSVSAGMQVHSGDPQGTGDGGCGYTLPKLFDRDMLYAKAGVLGLWGTSGDVSSQFFITLSPNPAKYNLVIPGIGHVVEGLDVAETLRKGDTVKTIRIEGDSTRLKEEFAEDLARWNAVLDRQPPRGAAAPEGAKEGGRTNTPPSRERPRPAPPRETPPATPPARR